MALHTGIRIRRFREVARLSSRELAEAVGVVPSALSHWERGSATPTTKHVEAVAKALGLSMAEFYGPLPAKGYVWLAHKLRDPKFYTARTKRAVNSLTVERGPKNGGGK